MQADAADRRRDGVRDDARAGREGDQGEAVQTEGGQDRFDGDRGRREVPDRFGSGGRWCQGAGPGGPQAGEADRGEDEAGAGSLAGYGAQAAGDHPHDPPPFGGGQGGGAEAHPADGRAAVALGQGGAPARSGRQTQGARARREGEADGRGGVGGDGRSVREGRFSDPPACRRGADHRPDHLPPRSGRPTDPQGQAGQADGVRVRVSAGGGDREHQARVRGG